jgi:hypothetical protein
MRCTQSHTVAFLALAALALPVVACAAGDMSLDVGPGAVTTQSQGSDSGTVADTGASSTTNLPAPSAPTSDDSGSPASDDAGSTSDDAGQTSSEDSAVPPPPPPPSDDSGTTSSCPGYAPPTTPASCDCTPSSSHTCAANGCYGGYYCKLSDDSCEKKPSSC